MKFAPLEFEKPIVELEKKLEALTEQARENNLDFSDEIGSLERKIEETKKEIYQNLTPWQRVQIARHNKRPYALDYIYSVLDGFVELHGDRLFGDDRAIVTGLASIDGQRVAVIGNQKGRDTKENLARNFGSAHPEGYRKALRVMRLAHKFGLPIISFIDTPGAYPGIGAEERHIAEAIAVNLREMVLFEVPIIAVVIGEGGSGGALGIGVADKVLILENAYYSVISPEGCAAILWKHRKHAPQAAEALKMAANDLKSLGLVDEVIPEPMGGAHQGPDEIYETVKKTIARNLRALQKMSTKDLLEKRYEKYREIGEFSE
ncbi:acetyl-CoA carboxylase carboxyltransferase subunit alpha [Kamptonema cortianum]|nr:acetyl-CoA carboxylase carboxyltransferase subunit alpha [Oscillatoria laete-virens]MDK3159920.1 acetyl-CoA carboxylase carboxyltransferase subunit alpha [Kamptonema cortianum]MDL5050511.1 acetyl-CoA carboxylase carboxyltransferase subunit alpha [Oscillatoria amoena NRMC-F 0135]MDL5055523.1 acetyl-CoA carboxylase carboxyltransferase subunit alpha [Oscillatoria laete-virens NRMC-F 0139]